MVDGCPPFFVFEERKIHLKRRENIAQGAKNKLHTALDIFIAAIIAVPG